jgi:hypothetical protein
MKYTMLSVRVAFQISNSLMIFNWFGRKVMPFEVTQILYVAFSFKQQYKMVGCCKGNSIDLWNNTINVTFPHCYLHRASSSSVCLLVRRNPA